MTPAGPEWHRRHSDTMGDKTAGCRAGGRLHTSALAVDAASGQLQTDHLQLAKALSEKTIDNVCPLHWRMPSCFFQHRCGISHSTGTTSKRVLTRKVDRHHNQDHNSI